MQEQQIIQQIVWMKDVDDDEVLPRGAKCYHEDCDFPDLKKCRAVICCINRGCGEYYCWRHKSKKHIPRCIIDSEWPEVCIRCEKKAYWCQITRMVIPVLLIFALVLYGSFQ